jgi:hypothetical protein
LSKKKSELFEIIPYVDPKTFTMSGNNPNSLNEKSDIYSVSVLLWKISSGKIPFCNTEYDFCLAMKIFKGLRKTAVCSTPIKYANLYNDKYNILNLIICFSNLDLISKMTFMFVILIK